MPNNQSVVDVKPENYLVSDVKSNNFLVADTKPNNFSVDIPTQVYLTPITGTITIPAGQWIPLAGFTYPQSIDMVQGGGVRP